MRGGRNSAWALVVGLILVGLEGCDGGGTPAVSSSTVEVTVSGTVKANGSPVTTGDVVFSPANIRRPNAKISKAPLDKDGKYSVQTLVGENQVVVQSPAFRTRELQYNQTTFDVPDAGGTLDISLPRK